MIAVFSDEMQADSDRKSTRLNSSHSQISYAVFCLKKKHRTLTLWTRTQNCCEPSRLPQRISLSRAISSPKARDSMSTLIPSHRILRRITLIVYRHSEQSCQ